MKSYLSLCALAFTCLVASSSFADVLFEDTFNRADSVTPNNNLNIQASLTGITNNTGTAFVPAESTGTTPYTTPFGGSARTNIEGNQLFLADGAGTSNAFVNHNFINADIITAGGFSVSIDVAAQAGGTNSIQGGSFGIGMTMADALTAADPNNNVPKITGAMNTNGTVLSDFWVGLIADNTITWGTGNTRLGTVDVGANTGTISAEFTGVTDFNDGTSVDFAVFYNGTAVTGGTGSFAWTGTDANYIGLDGLNPAPGTAFDNFQISTLEIPEPASMALFGLGALFMIRHRKMR